MPLGLINFRSFVIGKGAVPSPKVLYHMTIPTNNFPIILVIILVVSIFVVDNKYLRLIAPATFAAFCPILDRFSKLSASHSPRHSHSTTFYGAKIAFELMARWFANYLSTPFTRGLNAAAIFYGLVIACSRTVFCRLTSGRYVSKFVPTDRAFCCYLNSFVQPFTPSGAKLLCPTLHIRASAMQTGARF